MRAQHPRPQQCRTRAPEDPGVVLDERIQICWAELHDLNSGHVTAAARRQRREPDGAVREDEPRALVVCDLRHDPVETGTRAHDFGARMLPECDPVPAAPMLGADDVEPEKRPTVGEAHERDARNEFTIELADKEPTGIRGEERVGVGRAWVPPLCDRPAHDGVEFGPRHPTHHIPTHVATLAHRSRLVGDAKRAAGLLRPPVVDAAPGLPPAEVTWLRQP